VRPEMFSVMCASYRFHVTFFSARMANPSVGIRRQLC
jgi:hypothetical protein